MKYSFGIKRRFHAVLLIYAGAFTIGPMESYAKDAMMNATSKSHTIDRKRIHSIYSEGDFDGVITAIDSFTAANRTYPKDDSVFIAKHLAVVYTANPATREKGKHYMFRLLELVPSAKIVDMFVSDEIDRIFERVREEFTIREGAEAGANPDRSESGGLARDEPPSEHKPKPRPAPKANKGSGVSSAFYWVAGGATVIAVGAYFLLQTEKPADKSYVVPD